MTAAVCLSFTVPGRPVPLARARVTRPAKGKGKTRTFTPGKSAAYEETVHAIARAAVARRIDWPREKRRYAVEIDVFVPDRRRADIDNILKAILDGMSRAVYRDDGLVDQVVIRRTVESSRPRAVVTVMAREEL